MIISNKSEALQRGFFFLAKYNDSNEKEAEKKFKHLQLRDNRANSICWGRSCDMIESSN